MESSEGESDPDEARWCAECREEVARYLSRQGLEHGEVGEWPAWHIEPYVSIWAIESLARPGWVGWWAICGDLPTDYISADSCRHPRLAMKQFAENWLELVPFLREGRSHPTARIPVSGPDPEHAELLATRAGLLLEWSGDDSVWEPEPD